MNTFRYFAYGSNMLSRRLRERTPSAQAISSATLNGYQLTFHKVSKDGSGKCHIERTDHKHDSVVGVLFEIDESEKEALDQAEGLGSGYDECVIEVILSAGDAVEVTSYVGTVLDDGVKPYCWYRSLVIEGAREHSLPASYIEHLKAVEFVEDSDAARKHKHEQILLKRTTPSK